MERNSQPASRDTNESRRSPGLLARWAGSLRTKIFLLFALVAIAVLFTSFALVKRRIDAQIETLIDKELRVEVATMSAILGREEDARLVTASNIAASPRLMAAVLTRDPATVQNEAQKFREALGAEVFAVADSAGTLLAASGIDARMLNAMPALPYALRGQPVTDTHAAGGRVLQVAIVPLGVTEHVAGVVIVGNDVRVTLDAVRPLIDGDLSVIAGDSVLYSTSPRAAWPALVRTAAAPESITVPHVHPASLDGERTLVAQLPISPFARNRPVLAITRSVDDARTQFRAPISHDMVLLALGTLLALVGASFVIARTVTQPVRALVGGARALQAGDLDHRIRVASSDELAYLADAFDAMRVSLKAKIDELSALNRDLAERMDELRAAQETLVRNEKLAATGQLVAQLSHELNNPIHNVQNSLEVIRRRLPESDERRAFLDMARGEIERMARLTRQLLDFHRPVHPAFADVDVRRVVEDTLVLSQSEMEAAHVRSHIECDENVPLIRASADHLRQVFLNLVINAVEAMPNGGDLRIGIGPASDAVVIRVSDTGVGIPPEARPKVFDAFFTTKGAISGVGLGLSVTWGIVREHHGTIDVTDTPGGGTTFTLRLPVNQPEDAA